MRFVFILALAAANIFLWTIPVPHGLSVSFFNVGEGDAVFVQGPTGTKILIDGGPAGGGVLRAIGSKLPFFDRSLDAVISTTPTASESAGLVEVLQRYRVKNFFDSGSAGDTKTASVLSRAIADTHAKEISVERGTRIMLGGGAYADVLPSPDALIVKVVYGRTSFLLMSEASLKSEQALLAPTAASLTSEVLLVGKHGSKNASSQEFVEAIAPTYAIISRGCDNKFKHPAPEVVALLQNLDIKTFDTCTDGTVTFVSDSRTLTRQ